jgi:hypothetical protein
MTEQNLYAEFTQKRFSLDVTMPFTKQDGSEVKLPMVVLTGRELFEAKKSAEKATMSMYDGKMPKKDEASSYEALYEENLCWQLVFYSVRMPGNLNKKFFPEFNAVLDMLTPDQAGILKDCYVQLQISQPWIVSLNSQDDVKIEDMIQRLIEGGTKDSFFLSSLSSVSATLLIMSLISRLKSFMADSNVPGTLPDNTET